MHNGNLIWSSVSSRAHSQQSVRMANCISCLDVSARCAHHIPIAMLHSHSNQFHGAREWSAPGLIGGHSGAMPASAYDMFRIYVDVHIYSDDVTDDQAGPCQRRNALGLTSNLCISSLLMMPVRRTTSDAHSLWPHIAFGVIFAFTDTYRIQLLTHTRVRAVLCTKVQVRRVCRRDRHI